MIELGEKGYDGIMIECREKRITKKSMVCVSPYDTKSKKWLCGLMIMTSMEEALKSKKKKVAKDKNVQDYLEKHYKENDKQIN